jgi:galactitol-specific phosphotransferase system IIC component
MTKKGMSATLMIVVTAIIVLIIALVLITIFSGAITPLASLAQAKNSCQVQAETTCTSTGGLPATWSISSLKVPDDADLHSCQELWACNSCSACQSKWRIPV